ncbi:MAG: aldo/keto reductase [Parcubacteria group bacterium Gr01-1014_17]|nr:MAG: aldo/keto reductase [Parcubacteria group bacterium Gr01-1014_17]
MEYRALGKTGMKVSVVGIETHQWSGMGGRLFSVLDIRAILARAEKSGINFIDTGECYFFHAAERLLGDALGKNRKKFIIATKFGHKSEPQRVVPAWTKEAIQKSLENSMKALNTDYIDLYQIHLNSTEDAQSIRTNISSIKEVLHEAWRTGKVRAVGICLGDNELFDTNGALLKDVAKMLDIEIVQFVYSRLAREAEKQILPFAKKHELGVIARAPLSKGYLSTRFKPTNKSYDAERMKEVEKIKETEVPAGADLSEWAIAWCASNPLVSSVVPGCSAPEQIDSTVRALKIKV